MTTIHRLLDDAFAGIEPTPDVQDLKEEIRANLESRAAELEAAGSTPDDAARGAIRELGDIHQLIDDLPAASATPWGGPPAGERVRPKPAFVVRIVIASAVAAASLVTATLGILSVLPIPIGALVGLLGLSASAIGWIVGDALAQETSTNHPMPTKRAGGFYLATSLLLFGLGLGWLVITALIPIWVVVFAVLAFVLAIVLYAVLGATQTNRLKTWALRRSEQYVNQGPDRFSQDPAAAARFGIYTVVIWTIAFVAFLVLSFTVGWAWSWLALVGGFLLMMIVLARMLFPPTRA
jgi:hypothetical protein